jgi:hypothetical protein
MPNYRRAFEGGRTWFFTVNLLDRKSGLLVEHIDALREAVRETRQGFPFERSAGPIVGWVKRSADPTPLSRFVGSSLRSTQPTVGYRLGRSRINWSSSAQLMKW